MSLAFAARVAERDFDVTLELADGETLALLGPNAAGKSTVLALTAGLLVPDEGRVVLDERVLAVVQAGRRQAWVPPHVRRVSLLAQDPLLFPHLSVRGNVAFGPRAQGRPTEDADAWLARLGLDGLSERRPRELSGGQQQRVAVARALAAAPRLLLLDEPMAALDVDATPALREALRVLLGKQSTIIATHDVLDALLLADRVAVLDGGRVVEHGPTGEVLARPQSAFAARIAGLNLLAGVWSGGAVQTATGERVHGQVHGDPPVSGTRMVAVCRPTSVAVYLEPVQGSPRNCFPVTVTAIEPVGGLVRIRTDMLSADVTAGAARELGLVPGARAWFAVKATEVDVYPAHA